MVRVVIVRVVSYPQGPRVWIAGQRCHHGAAGAAIIAVALRRRGRARAVGVLVGAILCAHDRHDWRAWLTREKLPALEALTNDVRSM
jgi:hypothetical protein